MQVFMNIFNSYKTIYVSYMYYLILILVIYDYIFLFFLIIIKYNIYYI